MAISKRHLAEQLIPAGMQIYQDGVEVAGIHYRRPEAIRFIRNSRQSLEFEPEPENPHSALAIKVVGIYHNGRSAQREPLGYVPHEYSHRMAASGLTGELRPRLKYTLLSDRDYVNVEFQILGPKGRLPEWAATEEVDTEAITKKPLAAEARATPPRAAPKRRGCASQVGLVLLVGLGSLVALLVILAIIATLVA